jgi:hypothetical protein
MSLSKRDDARHGGLARAVALRVLNRRGYVSPEIQRRIEEAKATLGYRPDRTVRLLRGQSSDLIGPGIPPSPTPTLQVSDKYKVDRAVGFVWPWRGMRRLHTQSRFEDRPAPSPNPEAGTRGWRPLPPSAGGCTVGVYA